MTSTALWSGAARWRRSKRLLELAAAYDMQAKVYGGLSPAIRRKLHANCGL
jgi:hypothetical protein